MKVKRWLVGLLVITTLLGLSACSKVDTHSAVDPKTEEVTVYLLTEYGANVGEFGPKAIYSWEYDPNGNLLNYSYFTKGNEQQRTEWEYDSEGKLTKKIGFLSGEQYSVTEYKYDNNGKKIEEINNGEWDDDKTSVTKFEYDSNGYPSKEIRYVGEKEYYRYEWEYDARGNMLKELRCNDGRKPYSAEYTYDSNDNLIEEEVAFEDTMGNEISWVIKYTYNDIGKLIQEIEIRNKVGTPRYTDYVYDASGNKIEESWHWEDSEKKELCYKFFYDDRGNLIKEMHYRDEEETAYRCYEYEYDSNGNQIKRIHFADGQERSRTVTEYDAAGMPVRETNSSDVSEYENTNTRKYQKFTMTRGQAEKLLAEANSERYSYIDRYMFIVD